MDNNNQNLNLLLAVVLSIAIIAGWQYFFEKPRLNKEVAIHKEYNNTIKEIKNAQTDDNNILSRSEAISSGPRLSFANSFVKGSINLNGFRIDDLTLLKYKQELSESSGDVVLLSPNKTKDTYFAELGWISSNKNLELPNQESAWTCDKTSISTGETSICKFSNSTGIEYKYYVSIDDKYMFNIKQEVTNKSLDSVSIQAYGLVYKTFDFQSNRMSVVHEGFSGVFDNELKEFSYSDVKDKKVISNKASNISWFGISDKYWLVSFVPDKNLQYTSNTNFLIKNSQERYKLDFVTVPQIIEPNSSFTVDNNLFGGAKELNILDEYQEKLEIKLFDRTVDFGWFYVITRPLLWVLIYIDGIVKNFGISILLLTVLIKLLMFNLSNRSYKSMKKMRELQPQIERLKTNCGEDKTRFNQEVMNLYKVNNVNPLSGCLPILVQIPVFFSLYKVLNVAIDMRHAPFFGWIRDLSVPDPTNLFNLFGLIPFTPPSFLHIGIWPLLMALTMFVQQKMSPPPSDPVQAQVMSLMPVMFVFMFSGFPAGLLIYWTWSNILSIAQQSYINYINDKA